MFSSREFGMGMFEIKHVSWPMLRVLFHICEHKTLIYNRVNLYLIETVTNCFLYFETKLWPLVSNSMKWYTVRCF